VSVRGHKSPLAIKPFRRALVTLEGTQNNMAEELENDEGLKARQRWVQRGAVLSLFSLYLSFYLS